MNTEEIKSQLTKELDWTPKELKNLQDKKKKKANDLLLKLINKGDEKSALVLVFDDTLEVNAHMHLQDYLPLYLAIGQGMTTLVKESFFNTEIKHKLNLDSSKNYKRVCEEIAKSNSIEMYELINSFKIKPSKLLNDTFYYALDFAKLNLIKELVNKSVEGHYIPVFFTRAVNGYKDAISADNKKDLFEYTSYFSNIENHTTNPYINALSKETFFNSKLLGSIITKEDEESLKLYKKIISPTQQIKDITSIMKENAPGIEQNNLKIVNALKWFFSHSLDIEFKTSESIKGILNKNEDLKQYYDKIQLNHKFQNKFPEKDVSEKKLKI